MRNALRGAGALVASLAIAVGDARAQGYGVYEHDACVMARSGTGVAAPCGGGSAVFFNPAGILGSPNRWNAQVGVTMIAPRGSFTDSVTGTNTESVANNIPVPSLFVTRQINDRWAIGFGMFAPYGLISEWPNTFDGRFLAYKADLKTLFFQPTVAWRPMRNLRVGAGVTYVYAHAELRQRVDLAGQATTSPGVTFAMLGIPTGTDFADATLNGSSFSASGHFGILWDVNSKVSIGARYLLRQTADIAGDATFEQIATGIVLPAGSPLLTRPAPLPPFPAGTSLDDSILAPQFRGSGLLVKQRGLVNVPLPDQFVVGVALHPMRTLTLLFDYQWVNWSRFEALEISFEKLGRRVQYEDYRNTDGYRVGVEWQATPRISLRGGTLYHTAAAPPQTVTPLLPEGERSEGTFGLGYQLSQRLRLDLAYQYIKQQDRRGRIHEAPLRGPGGAIANTGLYTSTANLFGASLAFGF